MKRPPVPERYSVIAEIAGAHMGDPARCALLIDAAHRAGADIVKFQIYRADELCQSAHPDHALFERLSFTEPVWADLFARTRQAGCLVYADVFGEESFSLASRLGADGFKLHPSDLNNAILLERIAATEKPLLLGIGGHKRIEIYEAVCAVRAQGSAAGTPLFLMVGHQRFPTPLSEHSLAEIRWFADAYRDRGVAIGVADHCDGDDPVAAAFPLAALGAGAVLIEKHLTLDRSRRDEDHESALEPEGFAALARTVHRFRECEVSYPQWTPGRQHYRAQTKKVVVARSPHEAGTRADWGAVSFVRGTDRSGDQSDHRTIGRPLTEKLAGGALLTHRAVSQRVGALITCRSASVRLPQKALLPLAGKESIALVIERARACASVTPVVLCTTNDPQDDALAQIARREGAAVYRGQTEDVARRLYGACREHGLDHFVRITGDDLLRDIPLIDDAVALHIGEGADYTRMEKVVYSCDSEVISVRALRAIVERANEPRNTEYLTWYLDDPSAFICALLSAPEGYDRPYRLTLDTAEDLAVFQKIYDALYRPGKPVDLRAALCFLDAHQDIAMLNARITPKLARGDIDTSLRI